MVTIFSPALIVQMVSRVIYLLRFESKETAKEMLCFKCGTKSKPKIYTKGNIDIEIVLWLFLIIPGWIYSIWRHISRYEGKR